MLATKEKSHPGFQLPTAPLHPGFGFVISNTATEFHASVYDFCGGPLSSGYFRDSETQLDYAKNRYHQPGMGRFLTPDAYQNSAGPQNPGSWNRYAYTGGDPVNRVDHSGLYYWDTGDGVDESDDGTCGANWMTDASLSGPCGGSGGGGDGDSGNVCGGNSFFNSETGSLPGRLDRGRRTVEVPRSIPELD